MPESLLTIEEVARYLKVDKFTVYRLVAKKSLPAPTILVGGPNVPTSVMS